MGGLLLVWIALKLVRQSDAHGGEEHVRQGTTLLGAIWIILVADVVMSLDNVIGVAGAAEGDMRLVVFGIALSIPIVVWGSGVLARLMNRYPWIILVAGGILGEVAGKMIAARPVHREPARRRRPTRWSARCASASRSRSCWSAGSSRAGGPRWRTTGRAAR